MAPLAEMAVPAAGALAAMRVVAAVLAVLGVPLTFAPGAVLIPAVPVEAEEDQREMVEATTAEAVGQCFLEGVVILAAQVGTFAVEREEIMVRTDNARAEVAVPAKNIFVWGEPRPAMATAVMERTAAAEASDRKAAARGESVEVGGGRMKKKEMEATVASAEVVARMAG